jgi:heat shock protein HspQ
MCSVAGPDLLGQMAAARTGSGLPPWAGLRIVCGWLGIYWAVKAAGAPAMDVNREAKFSIGQQVRHRFFPFRGIIFDVDPEFANTEEWWTSIPEDIRPRKEQPFYHLLAENESSYYVAYVSEQNLLPDDGVEPVNHPQIPEMFELDDRGMYRRSSVAH